MFALKWGHMRLIYWEVWCFFLPSDLYGESGQQTPFDYYIPFRKFLIIKFFLLEDVVFREFLRLMSKTSLKIK